MLAAGVGPWVVVAPAQQCGPHRAASQMNLRVQLFQRGLRWAQKVLARRLKLSSFPRCLLVAPSGLILRVEESHLVAACSANTRGVEGRGRPVFLGPVAEPIP